jgi:hypothetical protein
MQAQACLFSRLPKTLRTPFPGSRMASSWRVVKLQKEELLCVLFSMYYIPESTSKTIVHRKFAYFYFLEPLRFFFNSIPEIGENAA